MTVVTRLCQVTDTINFVYAKSINIKLNHNENLKKSAGYWRRESEQHLIVSFFLFLSFFFISFPEMSPDVNIGASLISFVCKIA